MRRIRNDKKLTDRQAIGVLDGLRSNPLFGETHRQAFEIGIKAIKTLDQESCDDWYDVPSDEMTLRQARKAVKDLRKELAEYRQAPTISREALLDVFGLSESKR